jgi:hypothetical protein
MLPELQKDVLCDCLNRHPQIHGLCRRPILDSYSKLRVNFGGRSPDRCAMLHYRLDAQLFLQPHSYLTERTLRLTYQNSFFGFTGYLKQKYVKPVILVTEV